MSTHIRTTEDTITGHKIVPGVAGPLLLGSCALFGLQTTYLFKHNPNQADPSA